jgi:hypothetical protein
MVFEVFCQSTLRPSLFTIGSLDKLLIPFGQLFQLQYKFLT